MPVLVQKWENQFVMGNPPLVLFAPYTRLHDKSNSDVGAPLRNIESQEIQPTTLENKLEPGFCIFFMVCMMEKPDFT